MTNKYLFLLLLLFGCILNVEALELPIHSQNAILYNLDEDNVLYEKNADEVISIASLTKIMTALIVIENVDNLDSIVTVKIEDFAGLYEANASLAGFYVGETLTIRDLLYGLLFPSGAEAAQALTRILGGKEHFIEMMNQKAADLGLQNTNFVNETGLDEEGHYSTVREVGMILKDALQHESFKNIFETKEYQTSNKRKIFISSMQKFLQKTGLSMDYLLGGKTGTTENAGLCLASTASKNDTNYLLVTARADNDWQNPKNLYDAKTIYDYFIENYEKKILLEKGTKILELKTKYSDIEKVDFTLEESILKYVPNSFDSRDISIKYEGIQEITATIKQGSRLGILSIFYQDEKIKEVEIILSTTISFNILKYLNAHPLIYIFSLIIILLLFFIIKRKHRCKYET